MSSPKYKLLVLTDLSEACSTVMENAVNLSTIIDGSIDVFHVLKPSDIATYENQYSAMRSIDEERINKKVKLKTLVRKISKKTGVVINASCILGNLKDEAMERIEATNPDIIVLGKRTPKWVDFLGDNFTKFILENFNGSVLISGKENIVHTNEAMSLGLFNTTTADLPQEITQDLQRRIKNPIKQFHVRTDTEQNLEKNKNVITYEFESGTSTMDTIATYIAKNNIGLLCMNQQSKENSHFKNFKSNIKEAIQKINAPILIIKHKPTIQLQ